MTLATSLRAAARGVARNPSFAAGIVLVLALGIGLATAVFSVADAILLRPLAVADEKRVLLLWGEKRDGTGGAYPLTLTQGRDFARGSSAFTAAALYTYEGAAQKLVRDGDQLTRLSRALVSGTYFSVLGARPELGRALTESDDVTGAAPVAVLSHDAWKNRFAEDPKVIGRELVLHDDGVRYEIVGVMPPGLDFPRGTEFWTTIHAAVPERNLEYVAVNVVGRLRPNASASAARDELSTFFASAAASPYQRDLEGSAHPLREVVIGEADDAVLAVAIAAGLLLLVTCINASNLLLVRGLARTRELAVRAALGASRGAIVLQLLSESAVLAVAGGVIALPVAAMALSAFVAFAPANVPRLAEIALDGRTIGVAFAIATLSVLLFGIAPALFASRRRALEVLRAGSRSSGSRGSRRLSEALVVGQVALAVIIVAAAGVIGRSLLKLQREQLAFDPARMVVAELALSSRQYEGAPRQLAMLEELVPAVRALPGVQAVTPVVAVPFSGTHGWDGRFGSEGQSREDVAANPMLNMELVAPGHFSAFGIPVLRGRAITDDDRAGAPRVVVISESTARHYWPGADPVGRRLYLGAPDNSVTVVGVVADTRYRDLRQARASVYFPLRQSFFPFAPTTLAIRAEGGAGTLAPALRALLERDFPGVALAAVAPFEDFLARPLAQPRMNALLLATFAGAALGLAAIGLFGVMMLAVRQRTREMGVRIALGASPAALLGMILQRGATVAAIGTALGLAGAYAANRALGSLLYEVTPADPLTLVAVAAFTLLVGVMATAIPARASTRVDAVRALRSED